MSIPQFVAYHSPQVYSAGVSGRAVLLVGEGAVDVATASHGRFGHDYAEAAPHRPDEVFEVGAGLDVDDGERPSVGALYVGQPRLDRWTWRWPWSQARARCSTSRNIWARGPLRPYFGAAAKCFASDAAMKITTDAVQLLGGYRYPSEFPVERVMRDARITRIFPGTSQVRRLVTARELFKGQRR